MSIIFFLLILIAFAIVLLFTADARIKIVFDTDENDMHINVFWMYPFVKVTGRMDKVQPVLDFYLFKWHLFRTKIIHKKANQSIKIKDLINILNPKAISVRTKYGFRNPSATGITCGAVNAATQFINIDSIDHLPDFMATKDYIYLDAEASLNLGASLTNLLKYFKNRRNLQWSRTQA